VPYVIFFIIALYKLFFDPLISKKYKRKFKMQGTRRADIIPGIAVMVELTEDKRTGRLTGGRVKEVLTTSPNHPHGIKVMLENGLVGRIKQIV
jgi:uncharacterized repeat protein (TIGR03833 family)